ncbi:hypothetical protein FLONG3_3723 [Fusarium longipes]|uniref:Uncharacterized protein n=1 Tax=Fusarium longipes TaxID=694270 RepID=A0A395T075_9HYPO|nr:hypothetical protein FLONG3_3723 [Fusarium longipes]
MEIVAFYITMLAMLSTFAVTSPTETPFQAIVASCAAGLLALAGGAEFLGHVVVAIRERFLELPEEEEEDSPEVNLGSWRRILGHGPAEFDTHDRFYHAYGACCTEKGHCISCLKLYAERFREEFQEFSDEFDRVFKRALAK